MIYSTYRVVSADTSFISREMSYDEAIHVAKNWSDVYKGHSNPRFLIMKSVAYVEREPVVVKEEPTVNYLIEA